MKHQPVLCVSEGLNVMFTSFSSFKAQRQRKLSDYAALFLTAGPLLQFVHATDAATRKTEGWLVT